MDRSSHNTIQFLLLRHLLALKHFGALLVRPNSDRTQLFLSIVCLGSSPDQKSTLLLLNIIVFGKQLKSQELEKAKSQLGAKMCSKSLFFD
jgi:hypothetical protein